MSQQTIKTLALCTFLGCLTSSCSDDKPEKVSSSEVIQDTVRLEGGFFLLGERHAFQLKNLSDEFGGNSQSRSWVDFEIFAEADKKFGNLGAIRISSSMYLAQMYTVEQETMSHFFIKPLEDDLVALLPLKLKEVPQDLLSLGFETDGTVKKIVGLRNRKTILKAIEGQLDNIFETPVDENFQLTRIDIATCHALWEEVAKKEMQKAQAARQSSQREIAHVSVGSTMTLDYGKGVLGLSDVFVRAVRDQAPRVNVMFEDGESRWVEHKYIITKSSADKQRHNAEAAVLKGLFRLMTE